MALVKITRDVRLQRYFPDVLAPAKEFKALAEAENPEFKLLWDAAWKWMANTFVYDTDEQGLERWEQMLHLTPEPDASIDDRRAEILRCINSDRPYTERKFQDLLDGYYGEGNVLSEPEINAYVLWLNISAAKVFDANKIRAYARSVVPANLDIKIKNEKDASGSLYVGGCVRTASVIHIEGYTGFTAPEIKADAYTAGFVGIAKKITHIGGLNNGELSENHDDL